MFICICGCYNVMFNLKMEILICGIVNLFILRGLDGCGYCYIILIFLKRREMYKYIIVKYLNFIDKIFRFGLYKLYVFIWKFGVILCSLFVV